MKDVFLDTVGLIAVWDVADQWHAAADAAFIREKLELHRMPRPPKPIPPCIIARRFRILVLARGAQSPCGEEGRR